MNLSKITYWWINRNPARFEELHQNLIAIRFGTTLAQYVAYAIVIAGVGGIFGFLFGLFAQFALALIASGSILQGVIPTEMPAFLDRVTFRRPEFLEGIELPYMPSFELDAILAIRGVLTIVFPVFWAWIFYHAVLFYPAMEKSSMGTRITSGLRNVVAFMYAVRKGGTEILDVFRIISFEGAVYGEVSNEFRYMVRDCDIFGDDLITAVRERALTTPSVKLKEFSQDMLSIIEGGGSLTDFLKDRVQRFHEEAIFEQKQFLQFLGMVGEIYITTFIAGPLFLIVIMVVMGMMGASAVFELSLIAYIVLPLGSALFLLMIDMLSIKDSQLVRKKKKDRALEYGDIRIVSKGSESWYWARLAQHDKIKATLGWLASPWEGLKEEPARVFYFSVPIALISIVPIFLNTPLDFSEAMIKAFDSRIVIAYLIAIIPFSYLYEKKRRDLLAMENRIPDFLDRMAGLNAVGITLTQSISILSRSNLGALGAEIKNIEKDLSWGLSFGEALVRFEQRVQTAYVARAVTLINVASKMNSNISEILRIASDDTKMSITLRRDRFGEMFIYTAIVYLSYIVFIAVIVIVSKQFLSILAEQAGSGASYGMLAGLGELSLDTINRLLYHVCLVQALCSGLVAGLMGEESIYGGLKHGCVMLFLALIAFNVLF
jgi:flagellar protein FlaJ